MDNQERKLTPAAKAALQGQTKPPFDVGDDMTVEFALKLSEKDREIAKLKDQIDALRYALRRIASMDGSNDLPDAQAVADGTLWRLRHD